MPTTLRFGSKGPEVARLVRMLARHGCVPRPPVTSSEPRFGRAVENMVLYFQMTHQGPAVRRSLQERPRAALVLLLRVLGHEAGIRYVPPRRTVGNSQVARDGRSINTVEGNCGNRVKIGCRQLDDPKLRGFINFYGDHPVFARGSLRGARDLGSSRTR